MTDERTITLTEDEILAIFTALQFSIDYGLADDYDDPEILFHVRDRFQLLG
jgi:hypothetical protein